MRIAITDCRIPAEARTELKRRNDRVILFPPHPGLPPPVASHPDLLVFFAPGVVYTTALYSQIASAELNEIVRCTGLELRTVEQEPGGSYPHDILLDAAQVGKRLFCLPAHTARELTGMPGIKTVAVRQGYAKCSILPVGNRALITADPSVSAAAKQEGLDLLTIRPGGIFLPGYDTGFIGGAASFAPYGKVEQIFFCGDPLLHPDGQEMVRFCARHGFETVALSNQPLMDVGTIWIVDL